jgi:hypothetical protein
MPSGGKAILKVQYSFQKEWGDIAYESEIFRFLRTTVPALAHDFSSLNSGFYFLFTGKPFFCHGRSLEESELTYGRDCIRPCNTIAFRYQFSMGRCSWVRGTL